MKIRELTRKYLNEAAPHIRSEKLYERRIRTLIVPYLGDMDADAVGYDVLTQWTAQLHKRGKTVAFNAKTVLSAVYRHGTRTGCVKSNPCLGFELPKKYRPNPHEKGVALDDNEIVYLLTHLDRAVSPAVANVLRMILHTAARPSEVLAMRRSQIAGNKWWLPTEDVKTGVADMKVLNANALSLIESLPDTGDELFPVPYITVAQALIRAQTPGKRRPKKLQMRKFSAHALRRSVATGLVRLGIGEVTVSAVLNHAQQGVTSRYVVHDYWEEKEAAMAKWSDHVNGLMSQERRVA